MIREMTKNEKSCNPGYNYVFERNGYITWLTEGKFQQLANEVLKILEQNKTKNDVDKILSFNFGKETDCPLCHGAGFYSFSTFGGETTTTQKCSCGA